MLAASGSVAGVDVVFGSNPREGTMFVSDNNYTSRRGHYSGANLPVDINEAQFHDFAFGSWGVVVRRMMSERNVYPLGVAASSRVRRCPIGTYNTWWWAATRATGDFMMTCTARRAARQWASFGHDAYNFYFSHTPVFSVNTYPTAPWGAFRGSEVPFVWGAEFELTGAASGPVRKMVRFWSNFAKSGTNGEKPVTGAQADSGAERDPRATADAARDLPHWPRLVTNVSDGMIRLATGDWRPYTSDFDRANVSAVEALLKGVRLLGRGQQLRRRPDTARAAAAKSDDRSPAGSGNVAVAAARALRAEGRSRARGDRLVVLSVDYDNREVDHGSVQAGRGPHAAARNAHSALQLWRVYCRAPRNFHRRRADGQATRHPGACAERLSGGDISFWEEEWTKGPSLRKPRSGLGVVGVEDGGEAGGAGPPWRRREPNEDRGFSPSAACAAPRCIFAVPYVEVLGVEPTGTGRLSSRGARDEKAPLDARRRSARESHRALRRRRAGPHLRHRWCWGDKDGSTDSMWSLPVLEAEACSP